MGAFWQKAGQVAQGILSYASPIASSIFQYNQEKKQNQAQRVWASDEAEKAYQRNLQMWEAQNKYNDPSQKMARLKQAGLNPNLAYGNPATAGVATAPPQKEAPKGRFENPAKNINPLALANASLLQQQARSVQLDNQMKEYDLGLRSPKGTTHTIATVGPKGETVWETSKEFKDVPYFKRIQAQTQSAQYDAKVKALEAKLSESGNFRGDPKILRMIAVAMDNSGYSINDVTQYTVDKILRKLGFKKQ